MLTIRKGTSADLKEIWTLVQAAIAHMNAGGNPQWGPDYPGMTHFAQGIADGDLYAACGEDGRILGVAILNTWQEECYEDLTGWQQTPPALVIHKVAVHPDAQRQGVGSFLFDFAVSLAKEQGLKSIRIDTYCLNGKMQALIRKFGFHYMGNVHFPARPLAYRVYEKVL